MIKIAVVTQSESNGGAAIVAKQLAEECGKNLEVRIFSQDSLIEDANGALMKSILYLYFGLKRRIAGILACFESKNIDSYKSYGLFGSALPYLINSWKPDIVHLHWVGGELLSIEDIGRVKSPIVWTMHDCWPVVGSEHHETDSLFMTGRVSLIRLKERLSYLSSWVFRRKLLSYGSSEIVYVCPSSWVRELAGQSLISCRSQTFLIPNGVDTSLFTPYSLAKRRKLRKTYGISEESRVVLVGSMTSNKDLVKGFDLLIKCLGHLDRSYKYEIPITIVGLGDAIQYESERLSIVNLGRVNSRKEMADLYNACNVTCIPSRIETHSMMAVESICCGTPVAAFNVSGNSSVISDGKSGYLADPFDARSLARAICLCIEMSNHFMGSTDLLKARGQYSIQNMARAYNSVYESLLT